LKKVLIIAEAGVNHNGDIELAKKLINVAAEAGADYVKFQTFKAEKLASKLAVKADYQIKNTNENATSQVDMLRKLELKEEVYPALIEHCNSNKIKFLSSPFDEESVDFLANLGIALFKIPSGEITNYPYLNKIGKLNKEVILSTGMCEMNDIKAALDLLISSGTSKEKISVLHCNTEYPTPINDVNLNAMLTIEKEFGINIGYSDHTVGIEVPIAAVALGATIIEKHFTLDKTMSGPDHKASLEPKELKAMVDAIRNIEQALGNGIKKPSASEQKNMVIARKSIHFSKKINAGEILQISDLSMKRPGNGISPMKINQVLGKQLIIDVEEGGLLQWENIK
jgi:N-acetylneuraminate synthase